MKFAVLITGLVLGATAVPAPSSTTPAAYHPQECCFGINVYGVEGTVSEGYWGKVRSLDDGQLRIGQWDLKEDSRFCVNKRNLGMYQQKSRFGCILAGREQQVQCDEGKHSAPGWYIGSRGIVTFHGSAIFYSCSTGDHGGYNIYKQRLPGVDYCYPVALVADGCRARTPSATQSSASSRGSHRVISGQGASISRGSTVSARIQTSASAHLEASYSANQSCEGLVISGEASLIVGGCVSTPTPAPRCTSGRCICSVPGCV